MSSTTTSIGHFYYVYVLESLKDQRKYIGFTENPKKRLEEHNRGRSFATRSRRPLQPIYIEGCLNVADAKRREHYFKTTGGRRFLAKRLREYFQSKL